MLPSPENAAVRKVVPMVFAPGVIVQVNVYEGPLSLLNARHDAPAPSFTVTLPSVNPVVPSLRVTTTVTS